MDQKQIEANDFGSFFDSLFLEADFSDRPVVTGTLNEELLTKCGCFLVGSGQKHVRSSVR